MYIMLHLPCSCHPDTMLCLLGASEDHNFQDYSPVFANDGLTGWLEVLRPYNEARAKEYASSRAGASGGRRLTRRGLERCLQSRHPSVASTESETITGTGTGKAGSDGSGAGLPKEYFGKLMQCINV